MPYITKGNMIERFTEKRIAFLTDEENAEVIDDTVLDPAMAFADAKMDEYASRRYKIPMTTVGASAIGHLCDIAMYRLHDDQVQNDSEGARTSWRVRYEEAMEWLEKIADGDIPLLDDGGVQIPVDETEGVYGDVAVVTRDRVYTSDVMAKRYGSA